MTAFTCRSSGSQTTRSFRARSSRDLGPGISVTRLIAPTRPLSVAYARSAHILRGRLHAADGEGGGALGAARSGHCFDAVRQQVGQILSLIW